MGWSNGARARGVVCCVAALALAAPAAASAAQPPSVVGAVKDPVNLSGATAVGVAGHFAYATTLYSGRLTAVDISSAAGPAVAGESQFSTNLYSADNIVVSGGYAFVTSENRNGPCKPGPAPNNCGSGTNDDGSGNSLSIFDIHTNPAQPSLVGSLRNAGTLFGAYGVAVQGHYAYVAAQGCTDAYGPLTNPSGQPCPNPGVGNDFVVIDISNPTAPTIVGTVSNPTTGSMANALEHADSVALSGHYAYITASYNSDVAVIDISNPAAPALVSMLHDTTNLHQANDLVTQGNFAYVADLQSPKGMLAVLDISSPTAPKVVGTISGGYLNHAYRVKVSGRFAYVASDLANTVTMIDISNPASPQLVASDADGKHLNHTTGLDFVPGTPYMVASSPFLASESQSYYPPYPPPGHPATGTVSVINVDPNPVAVSITSPANGATFNKGQSVTASYSCAATGPFPLSTCNGPVANGAAIDTSTPGTHQFTVTGTDGDGAGGSKTVTYTVLGPGGTPPPPPAPAPVITKLHQKNKRWREHGKASRHKPPVGTVFTFTLNEQAKVTFTFLRVLPGRKVHTRCVAQTKANKKHHAACRISKKAGTLTLNGLSGANRVKFSGRIGRHYLKPGTYTLVITATANGKTATSQVTFTIV